MVAITDAASSSDSYVKVFRIVSPSIIVEIKEIDQFVGSHERKMLPSYDHFYAEVMGWSKDSKVLLIKLSGDYADPDLKIRRAKKEVTFRIPQKK